MTGYPVFEALPVGTGFPVFEGLPVWDRLPVGKKAPFPAQFHFSKLDVGNDRDIPSFLVELGPLKVLEP